MQTSHVRIRDYADSDYEACETLVNRAWDFDKHFAPQALSDLAKCMYTKGSVIGSNFKKVVEVDGSVAGFLFGFNEMSEKPKKQARFGWHVLRTLLFMKGMGFKEKLSLLSAINRHEANRIKIVGRGRSEIVLFVVSPEYQGYGYGTNLLSMFVEYCCGSSVGSLIVETNKLGASGFYEQHGFKHIGDFDSPLHDYVTKGGQPCIYEYRCE